MSREYGIEQPVDHQAGLVIDLLESHAANAKGVLNVRRRPRGSRGDRNFVGADLETQRSVVSDFAEDSADKAGCAGANVADARFGFECVDFEMGREFSRDPQVVAEFKWIVIMKDTGDHEPDRFILRIVP